jgi:hypothetical protein
MGLFGKKQKKEDSSSEVASVDLIGEGEPTSTAVDISEGKNDLELGWYYSENKDEFQMAKVAESDRKTHFYVIGATGTGKTKFLEFLVQQDIQHGNGFGVIDPHGDLIEDIKGLLIFRYLPSDPEISERVVLVDPTDNKYTVTFNPLEKIPGVSIPEQVNELISGFKKIWSESWGARMEDLMRNSLIALGEAELTLLELPYFLTHRGFRESVLEKVSNPLVQEYFLRFNRVTDRGQVTWVEPVMNKLNAFFADERIRQMFTSERSSFNIREIMDERKILLIKLDKGKLKDSADLLGSLLMAKIQMAAFSRSDVSASKRVPFFLYIDEFQNFASESFSVVLSEARKYGLSLIMAHQTLSQIPEELRSLILGNAGIQVYFRLNRHDAQILAKEAFSYSGYEVKSMTSHHPRFWTLGEEWEHYVAELQDLPLRFCYVKHKIQGGVIPIQTAQIESFSEIMEWDEDRYLEFLKDIPFGRSYLMPREQLAISTQEKQKLLSDILKAKEKERERVKEKVETKGLEETKKGKPVEREEPLPEIVPHIEVPAAGDKEPSQHRYFQVLIKRIAEDKGYKATIEQPTADGAGRIDVALERNGKKIACEISVTSTPEQELKNIEKCLAAGFEKVILCSPERKILQSVKDLVSQSISEADLKRAYFFQPDELFFFLEEAAAAESSKEDRIKGYRVRVQYQPVKESEKKVRREAVAQVMLQALKRVREN